MQVKIVEMIVFSNINRHMTDANLVIYVIFIIIIYSFVKVT